MEGKRENYSRKRAAILAALQSTAQHPTAEELFRALKPQYPDLSLATVYRNLNRFCETGQAASLGAVGGYERFDGETAPHAHLICSCCGRVVDIWQGMPDQSVLEAISGESGCRVESASVTFHGLCPQCSAQLTEESFGENF